jgi:hypothetical protein
MMTRREYVAHFLETLDGARLSGFVLTRRPASGTRRRMRCKRPFLRTTEKSTSASSAAQNTAGFSQGVSYESHSSYANASP